MTRNEKNLLSREVFLSPCNFIGGMPKRSVRVKAKIRYRQAAAPGKLQPLSKSRAKIVFDKPQRAVTPGQFAVIYKRNICLGAGEIKPGNGQR